MVFLPDILDKMRPSVMELLFALFLDTSSAMLRVQKVWARSMLNHWNELR